MKRFPSIKKNSDFQIVYRTGKSYANRQLVVYVKRRKDKKKLIGISVSKKVGNSVIRHRITRLILEIKPGYIGRRIRHHCGSQICCKRIKI